MHVLAELRFADWQLPFTEHYWEVTLCSLLVGVSCGILGCFVVLRRMALIGDALSHAVLPGAVSAFLLLSVLNIDLQQETAKAAPILMGGALIAGMITALMVALLGRRARTKEDSAIGIVFTALFAVGVIMISAMPRGTHFDLKCYLFGDALSVSRTDLWMLTFVTSLVVVWVAAMYHPLKLVSFDPVVAGAMGMPVRTLHYLFMALLSLTVVAGLTTVGVIMVVAMVVTPASAAYQLTNRFSVMLMISAAIGAVSAVGGLVVAFIVNVPTGPAMVVVATVIFGVCLLLSPQHGVLAEALRRRRLRTHVEGEDVLKALYHQRGESVGQLASLLRLPGRRIAGLVADLRRQMLLSGPDTALRLTDAGRQRAVEMVRSHRLWESYLADEANMSPEDVHEEAERLEHAHELADEVDRSLGHPERDPHGEPIPRGGLRPES